MKVVNLQQRTTPWHQWRNSGVTASEAIVVLGQCPYKTPYRLYAEKKGLLLPVNLDANPFVRRGIELEAVARRSFERRHQVMLLPICAESERHPFLRASFDGVSDEGIPTELKVPVPANWEDLKQNAGDTAIVKRYWFQVQAQIAVADAPWGFLSFYYDEREEPMDFRIEPDPLLIAEIIDKAREFAERLQTNQPPQMDPVRDIFTPQGKDIDAWNELAYEYRAMVTQLKDYKAKMEPLEMKMAEIEKQLISIMGEFAQGETAGLRVNRFVAKGAIDYPKALASICPDLDAIELEAYRKESSERVRLTLQEEGKETVPFSLEELRNSFNTDLWF